MSGSTPVSRAQHSELERLIETLASAVCATEQPRTVLLSSAARLNREVRETNRLATSHIGRR